jgi:type I restriction enzyme S subunit
LADYVNGRAFKPEDWGTVGLPIIRIAQITNPGAETNFYDGAVDPRNLIENGDLIFSWSATLAVMRWNKGPAVLNQHLFKVTPANGIDRDWLQFRLEASIPDLADEAHGTTMKHIRKGTLSSQATVIPPLDEQRRIAEVLRSVDEAIAAAENLAEQFQTVWHVLTERLIWDRLATSSDLAQPLGNALLGSDYGVNAPLGNERVGRAVLRMGNLQDGWIDPTDMKWGEIADAEAKALALDVGDLLFNRTNSRDLVGKVALVREPTDFLYASYIVRLRVNRAVADPYYLFAAMHSRRAQAQFKSIATPGVSQSNINPTNLKKQVVPLPPLAAQRDIAAQLQSTEDARRRALDQLAILRQIKSDLMTDLLTGRVRVPAVAASTSKTVPPAFKRAVFAAEIVQQLHNDNRFGSVKHEKIVHLCELHLGLQGVLYRHAYKEAAGPYDPKARRSVERIFQQQKWFDVTKPDGNRVVYVPLEKAGAHAEYFDRYFGEQKPAIQSIIDLLRPLNTEQCEIVATLYAVWNDFLIDKRQPGDDDIVASVLQWHPKKQQIAKDRWLAALPWMRQKGLIPKGSGEKTRVAQG